MKKVSLLATVFTFGLGTAAIAGDCAPDCPVTPPPGCPKAFEGFFLGGNVGYDVAVLPYRFSRRGGESFDSSSKLGARGIEGGLNVGYNQRLGFIDCGLENWGMGLEFVANWGNTDVTHKVTDNDGDDTYEYHAKRKNAMQVRGNLFYVIQELVAPKVYLGWETAKWSQNVAADTVGDNHSHLNNSKRHNAFLWGAGVDFLCSQHVILGFEYTGSAANKKGFTDTLENGDTVFRSIKPQNNIFSLTAKLIY